VQTSFSGDISKQLQQREKRQRVQRWTQFNNGSERYSQDRFDTVRNTTAVAAAAQRLKPKLHGMALHYYI